MSETPKSITAKTMPSTYPRYIIVSAFVLGLVTAIAMRALIVFTHVHPEWVRPTWYFAVIGNFVFFYYRFWITLRRKKAIAEFGLIEKVSSGEPLTDDERQVTVYLLKSIEKSLENYNYLIIFAFSIIAITLDIIMSALSR
jgi:predicted tellurium resistance membrane protein TerC